MALYPEGMFTTGPIAHLVGLAAGGSDPLEWEVLRFGRVTRTDYWDPAWRVTPQHLASQLDYLSTVFSEEFLDTCPEADRRTWRAAAGAQGVPAFMTELATLLRLADRQQDATYEDVPLAAWEVWARFPLLLSLDGWAYDGEYASYEESLRAFVEGEHPDCSYEVMPRLNQALAARTLCAESAAFAASFRVLAPQATPEALAVLTRTTLTHLTEHHA
ncbi:hypothetical protein [Streptomyces gardneri]|uniref:CdiI immunity protein domain-containing protein n=1 Tax=Streptomyces gardneri TaxID=66892 RepID=A0A4Y3RIF4_9ACTN|nr:hypothetical protein [Streptomyces gardneri]GEB56473.1 hypothetical protein SGA01_20780 [Streptomyces gardneri]GHH11625.1 hypothetical protein GCM10017674_57170 [Streptomyces gardneri]